MRTLLVLFLALSLMVSCVPALAEEAQIAETPLFSIEIPAGWKYDITDHVEQRKAYGAFADMFMTSPLQYQIRSYNDDYSISVYAYAFPKNDKAYVDRFTDRVKSCFDVLLQYSGMQKYSSQMSPKSVRFDTDTRTFMVAEINGEDSFLASYYNQTDGIGYFFYLSGDIFSDNPFDSATASDLLNACMLSLKEPGVNTTIDPNSARYIVIKNASANIRTGPATSYDKITTAYQGDRFLLLGEENNWYIIDVNGQRGYVSSGLADIQ